MPCHRAVGWRRQGRFLKADYLSRSNLPAPDMVCRPMVLETHPSMVGMSSVPISRSRRMVGALSLVLEMAWQYGGCVTGFRESSISILHGAFDSVRMDDILYEVGIPR